MINPAQLWLPLHEVAKHLLELPSWFMARHPPTQMLLRKSAKERLVMK
jgi:hypothetical protein